MPYSLTAGLRAAFQMQHPRYSVWLPGSAPLGEALVLGDPRVQGDDQLPPHQEPLHQEPHPDQPALHHARWPAAGYPGARRRGSCRQSSREALTKWFVCGGKRDWVET